MIQRTNESTSLGERNEAEFATINVAQEEALRSRLILKLKKTIVNTENSKLQNVNPFLD